MKSNVIPVGQVVPDVVEIRRIVKVLHVGRETDNEAWLVEIGDRQKICRSVNAWVEPVYAALKPAKS